MAGLFTPNSPVGFNERSAQYGGLAIGAYGRINPGQKTEYNAPGKTAGGALSAGAGMGLAGYQVGSMVGAGAGAAAGSAATTAAVAGAGAGAATGAAAGAAGGAATGAATGSAAGPWGAVIGAAIGLAAYFLS